MHLAYLSRELSKPLSSDRRSLLKLGMGGAMVGAMSGLGACATSSPVSLGGSSASNDGKGFKGSGKMDIRSGEDWIDTFFTGGASEIIHYYADDFVFEDITLNQAITDKDSLYRAFLPFEDKGPDSPAGVHQFDVIRYDGGPANKAFTQFQDKAPEGYSQADWDHWTKDAKLGRNYDYEEWGVMNWIWKAKHNMDFLGMPAKGKTTHCRGVTFHNYVNRKIVREFTYWEFRMVANQLGVAEPQLRFWEEGFEMPKG
ncbi:MAG: hypothetical protein ACRBEQ_10735 [Hyphomonas sp.]